METWYSNEKKVSQNLIEICLFHPKLLGWDMLSNIIWIENGFILTFSFTLNSYHASGLSL